jgi:hypothetical protein
MAWISGNRQLTLAEMQNNAEIIQGYGVAQGWSPNAICAILGNMSWESSLSPGRWGDYDQGGTPHAYGLVQWNPYTKYSEWAGSGWQDNGTRELERISYEAANGLQWSSAAPYTFTQFLYDRVSGIDTLTRYFCWYYEMPAVQAMENRLYWANYWANNLDWDDPPHPPPPDPPSPDPPEPPDPGPDPPGPGPTPTFPYWILFKFRGRGQIWL